MEEERKIGLPLLEIETIRNRKWLLEGDISMVYPEGLLVYGKSLWSNLLKYWPRFLSYCLVVDRYDLPFAKRLLQIYNKSDDLETFELCVDDVEGALSLFLDYYASTRLHPSPLHPDWIDPILEGSVEKLQKQIDDLKKQTDFSYVDETMEWLFKDCPTPDPEQLILRWQPIAARLFKPIKNGWGNAAK